VIDKLVGGTVSHSHTHERAATSPLCTFNGASWWVGPTLPGPRVAPGTISFQDKIYVMSGVFLDPSDAQVLATQVSGVGTMSAWSPLQQSVPFAGLIWPSVTINIPALVNGVWHGCANRNSATPSSTPAFVVSSGVRLVNGGVQVEQSSDTFTSHNITDADAWRLISISILQTADEHNTQSLARTMMSVIGSFPPALPSYPIPSEYCLFPAFGCNSSGLLLSSHAGLLYSMNCDGAWTKAAQTYSCTSRTADKPVLLPGFSYATRTSFLMCPHTLPITYSSTGPGSYLLGLFFEACPSCASVNYNVVSSCRNDPVTYDCLSLNCAPGMYYLDGVDGTRCMPCTACSVLQVPEEECSSSHDTVCRDINMADILTWRFAVMLCSGAAVCVLATCGVLLLQYHSSLQLPDQGAFRYALDMMWMQVSIVPCAGIVYLLLSSPFNMLWLAIIAARIILVGASVHTMFRFRRHTETALLSSTKRVAYALHYGVLAGAICCSALHPSVLAFVLHSLAASVAADGSIPSHVSVVLSALHRALLVGAIVHDAMLAATFLSWLALYAHNVAVSGVLVAALVGLCCSGVLNLFMICLSSRRSAAVHVHLVEASPHPILQEMGSHPLGNDGILRHQRALRAVRAAQRRQVESYGQQGGGQNPRSAAQMPTETTRHHTGDPTSFRL
jgi:hypothetical protein